MSRFTPEDPNACASDLGVMFASYSASMASHAAPRICEHTSRRGCANNVKRPPQFTTYFRIRDVHLVLSTVSNPQRLTTHAGTDQTRPREECADVARDALIRNISQCIHVGVSNRCSIRFHINVIRALQRSICTPGALDGLSDPFTQPLWCTELCRLWARAVPKDPCSAVCLVGAG